MRRPVNDAQKKALHWLATSPTDVPADTTFKLSARALQTRGLATVRRIKGVWTATLTDDGRFYADHGHYPHQPHLRTRLMTTLPRRPQAVDSLSADAPDPRRRSRRQARRRWTPRPRSDPRG